MENKLQINSYFTRHDGNNEEGLGSILQSQLHLYAYCKMNGLEYYFPGFENISHYQYTGENKNTFNKNINQFFNLTTLDIKTNNKTYIDPSYLIKNWGETYNSEKRRYISELFNLIKYDGVQFFDKNKTSISVHIRNINPQDVCFDVNRELYSNSKKTYFLNLIKNVLEVHNNNTEVLIFSQGEEKEFEEFTKIPNTRLFLNVDLLSTFYHLITSEVLITSNSSLSWCAHLYGKNKYVYSRNNFFHSWYPSTFLIDLSGNIL